MYANRYTALVDACSLAGALKRNLLLTLAEAEFFRVRWSTQILDETESAIQKILEKKGAVDAASKASKARLAMEIAFEEAIVSEYGCFTDIITLPDPNDRHVVGAAIKAQAATIVTENLKDFPVDELKKYNLEARSADAFIADTIALASDEALVAIRRMRQRLNRPEKSAADLLRDMEAEGLLETVNILSGHAALL